MFRYSFKIDRFTVFAYGRFGIEIINCRYGCLNTIVMVRIEYDFVFDF